MKISFDLDGTFLNYPDQLGSIAIMYQKWGHTIGVLSARNPTDIGVMFQGFPWDFIIGCTDNSFMTSDDKNAEWKSQQVQENNIDIHYDDLADLIDTYSKGSTKVIRVIP